VRALAAEADWERFLRLVRRHRVEGLANAALRRAQVQPTPSVEQALRSEATAIARQNLVYAVESLRLHRMFVAEELPMLFVKGLPLSALAFGDIALKKAWDIDLLVRPDDVMRACAILTAAGYERTIPGGDEEEFATWLSLCKESLWIHPEKEVALELHTRLLDNPLLLPGIDAAFPPLMVEVAPGISLPTLPREELFAYMCVHGAAHGWSRLKWLADVAALLAKEQPAEIERLYRRAVDLGAGRGCAQALLLSQRFFATELPELLESELRGDWQVRRLVRLATRVMTGGGDGAELDEGLFATVPILLGHFLIAPGWRFKLAEARLKLGNAFDRTALPRPLRPFYPLFVVPAWLLRRSRLKGRRIFSPERPAPAPAAPGSAGRASEAPSP
jgi:hypothetical protein